MLKCRLCSDLNNQDSSEVWNEPLFDSQNFVVLPSLGAIVEGWLLIVPKTHFICLGAMSAPFAAELEELKHKASAIVQQYYGQVCAFEHGPSEPNTKLGCGVDHAHLHIVPVEFDLLSAVSQLLPKDMNWSKAGFEECHAAFSRGEAYLYLEQPIGSGRISTHYSFESQLFRRAIAKESGVPSQFNWRDYPQLPNVSATIKKLQAGDESVLCKSRPEVAA